MPIYKVVYYFIWWDEWAPLALWSHLPSSSVHDDNKRATNDSPSKIYIPHSTATSTVGQLILYMSKDDIRVDKFNAVCIVWDWIYTNTYESYDQRSKGEEQIRFVDDIPREHIILNSSLERYVYTFILHKKSIRLSFLVSSKKYFVMTGLWVTLEIFIRFRRLTEPLNVLRVLFSAYVLTSKW